MDGYYNHRVFGNAFTLPYQVNRATYASAPVFLWQRSRREPAYRYKVMREFYSKWELEDCLYARTPAGFVSRTAQKHYVAPFACALYAILLEAMRHLRVWRPGRRPLGLAVARMIPLVCLVLAGLRLFAEPLRLSIPRWPTTGNSPLRSRSCAVRRLGLQRGGHRQV